MSKIEEIVDSLENKISKVLHKQEVLKQTNAKLSEELEKQQQKIMQQQEDIALGQKNMKHSKLQIQCLAVMKIKEKQSSK